MNVSISGKGDVITVLHSCNRVVSGPFRIGRAIDKVHSLVRRVRSVSNRSHVIVRRANHCCRPLIHRLSGTSLFMSTVGPGLVGSFKSGSLHGMGSSGTSTMGVTHCALSD